MVAAGNIPPRCARCCTDVHSTKESSQAAYRSVASGPQKVGFLPLRMSPLTGWCMHTAVKGKCPSVSAQSGFGPE